MISSVFLKNGPGKVDWSWRLESVGQVEVWEFTNEKPELLFWKCLT